MWTKTKTIAMAIMAYLGMTEIPINAEEKRTDFSDEAIKKLKAHFGEDYTVKMQQALDTELKEIMSDNLQMKAIQDELDALVKEKQLKAKTSDDDKADENNNDTLAKLKLVTDSNRALDAKVKELEASLQKMINTPEGDTPEAIIRQFADANKNRGMKLVHSNTHLFASSKPWDAFENRPWNERFRDQGAKATDFRESSYVPLLQDDVEHFVRENPTVLNSLFDDFAELPKEWDRRSGVLDRVSDGYIIPGEVVQGRSKGWKPKGKFHISAEEGKVFRKKIDIEFNGYELQEMENTWIRMYNKEGSHPWKMSFIGFLLSELVKRQKLDDRRAQINGIYVETPEDAPAGAAVNSQNGLRYLFLYYRDIAKKYRAFDLPAPTEENIVDYIEDMIKMIPEDDRDVQGMEIGLSPKWLKAYRERAGILYQHHYNTDTGKYEYKESYPIDRPNYLFQELKDMTKTDFIYITQSKNIQILDYDVSEKGKFTITHDKRETNIFADYRLGIRIKFVGNKLKDGDPKEFEVQKVWSNNVPVFSSEVSAPVFDDETGILKMSYPTVKVDAGWKTHIDEIEGAALVPGMILRIVGNTSLAANQNVVDSAKIDLASNFNLKSGGTLTLVVQDSGIPKELFRTSAPETAQPDDVNFSGDTIDADDGKVFRFTGTEDTSLADVLNGVEGKSIKIYGNDNLEADLTVATAAGKIAMSSSAVLAVSTDFVQLTKVDGIWRDTNRLIA